MKANVIIFRDERGNAPLIGWLQRLPVKVRLKCIAKISRLSRFGYELRRPDCDYLTDGIYELRIRSGNVNYRILYGFAGKNIALLSHGCTKEGRVPQREINLAIKHLAMFRSNPARHTMEYEV